ETSASVRSSSSSLKGMCRLRMSSEGDYCSKRRDVKELGKLRDFKPSAPALAGATVERVLRHGGMYWDVGQHHSNWDLKAIPGSIWQTPSSEPFLECRRWFRRAR